MLKEYNKFLCGLMLKYPDLSHNYSGNNSISKEELCRLRDFRIELEEHIKRELQKLLDVGFIKPIQNLT